MDMEGAGAGAGAGASSRRRRFVPSSERRAAGARPRCRAARSRAGAPTLCRSGRRAEAGLSSRRDRRSAAAPFSGQSAARGSRSPSSRRRRERLDSPSRRAALRLESSSRRRRALASSSRRRRELVSSARRRFLVVASTSSRNDARRLRLQAARRLRAPRGVEVVRDVGREPRRVDALEEGWFASAACSAGVTLARAASERVGLVYFIAVRGLELPLLVLAPRDLRVPRRDVRAEAVVLSF